MHNFWRHVRLAGIVLMCAGSWMPNVQLIVYGVLALLIGITYGLNSIEDRLSLLEKISILEKENTNEDERPH